VKLKLSQDVSQEHPQNTPARPADYLAVFDGEAQLDL